MAGNVLRRRETVAAACWIVLGLAIVARASTFPLGEPSNPGPGVLPLATGAALVLLGGLLLGTGRRTGARERSVEAPPPGQGMAPVVSTAVAIAVAAVVLERLGFTATVLGLVLFLMRVVAGRRWGVSLLYSALTASVVFLLFSVLLGMPLPRGVLAIP
jgi:hypothetical protein